MPSGSRPRNLAPGCRSAGRPPMRATNWRFADRCAVVFPHLGQFGYSRGISEVVVGDQWVVPFVAKACHMQLVGAGPQIHVERAAARPPYLGVVCADLYLDFLGGLNGRDDYRL